MLSWLLCLKRDILKCIKRGTNFIVTFFCWWIFTTQDFITFFFISMRFMNFKAVWQVISQIMNVIEHDQFLVMRSLQRLSFCSKFLHYIGFSWKSIKFCYSDIYIPTEYYFFHLKQKNQWLIKKIRTTQK